MDQEYEDDLVEVLLKLAEENQTRKILALLNEVSSLEEARDKVKGLLAD